MVDMFYSICSMSKLNGLIFNIYRVELHSITAIIDEILNSVIRCPKENLRDKRTDKWAKSCTFHRRSTYISFWLLSSRSKSEL